MATVLLGSDLSDNAADAARWALGLCQHLKDLGDVPRLVVTLVVAPEDLSLQRIVSDRTADDELDHLHQELIQWWQALELSGVVEPEFHTHLGGPVAGLVEAVEAFDASWLVVGQTGRGRIARFFLGTTAERLARRPPCHLALVHPDGFHWDQAPRALAAIAREDSSDTAMKMAAEIVAHHGGSLRVLHILELPRINTALVDATEMPEALSEHLREHVALLRSDLQALVDGLPDSLDGLIPDIEVRAGYATAEILAEQKALQANLLTLGTRQHSPLDQWLLGSVGLGVLRRAPCTVIVAPPKS